MNNIKTVDKVLLSLLESNTFISGEQIAKELSISRSAIHKRVEKLRKEGYTIKAESNRGFLLQTPYPHHIILEQIHREISPNHYTLLLSPQTKSTNTLAKELVTQYKEPFILLTRDQVQGRGRMNRTWEMSPDKDIAMSFVVPCDLSPNHLFSVIQLVSLSILKVLNKYSDDSCQIKWPNDIIANNQKICGILTESILEDNLIKYMVIGIGINVNSDNTPDYAISLKELSQKEQNINKICGEIINHLIELWDKFPSNKDVINKEWEGYLAWKGEKVSLNFYDEIIEGVLKKVTDEGHLVLEIDNKEVPYMIGDLSKIRLRKS